MRLIGMAVVVIVGGIALGFVLSLICAIPVMLLWNWLCTELFGLSAIGF